MVIVITGILLVVVAVFIVPATTAYLDSSARAQLADEADTALRRIGRDVAIALPNSTRITGAGSALELIPTTSAARYATGGANPLLFGTVDASFSVVGPPLTLVTGQQALVFYNLGPGNDPADAYTQANLRLAGNGAGDASVVNLIGGVALPVALDAPPHRVYAVRQPVSYHCDLGAATLTRYWNYGFQAAQPNPPGGSNRAVLATGVTDCLFSYDPAVVAGRAALLTLRLGLSRNGETVTLHHALHVENLP